METSLFNYEVPSDDYPSKHAVTANMNGGTSVPSMFQGVSSGTTGLFSFQATKNAPMSMTSHNTQQNMQGPQINTSSAQPVDQASTASMPQGSFQVNQPVVQVQQIGSDTESVPKKEENKQD